MGGRSGSVRRVTTTSGFLSPSEAATGVPAPASEVVGADPAPAVLLGGSEDTRLLLRGLLRLHRHRVLLETQAPEGIARVPTTLEAKVLVFDTGGETDRTWSETLSSVLRSRPDFRALVILPSTDPALDALARKAGARMVLVRPFAIREFIAAVDSTVADAAPA